MAQSVERRTCIKTAKIRLTTMHRCAVRSASHGPSLSADGVGPCVRGCVLLCRTPWSEVPTHDRHCPPTSHEFFWLMSDVGPSCHRSPK